MNKQPRLVTTVSDLRNGRLPTLPPGTYCTVVRHGRPKYLMIPCTSDGAAILPPLVLDSSVTPEQASALTTPA